VSGKFVYLALAWTKIAVTKIGSRGPFPWIERC